MTESAGRAGVERRIVALAWRQHRVARRDQLLARGLGERAIRYRVTAGLWWRVHAGVYALGPGALTREGEFMAGALACGADALLAHPSATALWALLGDRGGYPHVLVPGRRAPRRRGLITHSTVDFEPGDVAIPDGIPVTSVARTLRDIAVHDPARLRRACGEAIRVGKVTVAELAA